MSEVTASFTIRFADAAQADIVHHGFALMHKGSYADAKSHFESNKTDLWIRDTSADWDLEEYKRDGNYLSGVIRSGPLSFDENEFFKIITRLGATHIIANMFNDQVGEGYTFATKKGKKSSAKVIFKELAAENIDFAFALALAVSGGKSKDALNLIKQGANSNGCFAGDPLLAIAAFQRMGKVASALLEHGANPNAALGPVEGYDEFYRSGQTALQSALQERDSGLVKKLLDAGADVNKARPDGATALHFAFAYDDTFELAKLLIEAGATINEPYSERFDGLSPFLMMLERSQDHYDEDRAKLAAPMLDYMIEHGADIHATCMRGGNAAWYAEGHQALRSRLAELGCATLVAPDGAYDGDLKFNLSTALAHGDNAKLEMLLQQIAAQPQSEKDKMLETAVLFQQADFAKTLIERGANPAARLAMNMTLFDQVGEVFGQGSELYLHLKDKMKSIFEQESANIERASAVLRSFEKWFVGLKDYDDLLAKGAPYFTDAYLRRERDSRDKYTFGNLQAMSVDASDDLTAFIFGNEGDVRFFRPFAHTNGSAWIGVITMHDEAGQYRISRVAFAFPFDVDEHRYR